MLEIPLSQIKALPFEFGGAVDKYINDLKEHRLKTGAATPSAPHPLVEKAVARVQFPIADKKPDDFVAAYSVVDDSPSLDQRKVALANAVMQQATDAIHAVVPPLKAGWLAYQVSDARSVDENKRTSAHKTTIGQDAARQKKIEAIRRHMAKLHNDIDDLTDATIDGWKAAPFPT